MKSAIFGLRVAGVIFAIVALLHILRLGMGLEITVNGHLVPMWLSVVGLLLAGGMTLWMGKLACRLSGPSAPV